WREARAPLSLRWPGPPGWRAWSPARTAWAPWAPVRWG
ncbi:MAG: hypothetical protein AVDCRST_MAG06-2113, partial [uncultured Nocardioides sp.]